MLSKVCAGITFCPDRNTERSLGRNRVEYTSRLFDEVVNFSRKRIYARLRCSLWEKPAYTSGSNPPLYKQVRKRLLGLGAGSLKSALVNLIESLQKVDSTSVESRMDSLKDVIHKSHAVSHHAGSKSLENALCRLGVDNSICQSREVLEIDKLSRYLELCNDLVRLSRQPTTRRLYRDMKLEICTSYPGSQPPGALVKCFVHGEIQLILFYEQYPKQPLPRAIGSSKSACFLCDLFVKEHGGFGISYSHMKLYPKWTIPEVPWMNAAQIQRFRDIIETMDSETKQLLKKKFYHCNTVMESRAHILQIVQRSEIASSVASPAASQPRLIKGREIQMPGIDSVASALSLTGDKTTTTLYYFQDLPISVKILVGTISCTLLVGKVDYVFDLSEVDIGQLLVSECSRDETIPDELRVDIRNLSSSPHYLNGGASQNITFYLHDAEKHELRVSLTWDGPVN